MANETLQLASGARQAPGLSQRLTIVGRCIERTKEEPRDPTKAPFWISIVKSPNRDEFSGGDSWKVLSRRPIAPVGESVTVECDVRSYRRQVKQSDGSTRSFFDVSLWAANGG